MFYSERTSLVLRSSVLAALSLAALAVAAAACSSDMVEPSVSSGPGPRADAGSDSDTKVIPVGDYDAAAPPPFDAGQASGTPPRDAECNLNGRWLVTQRILASAVGQDQASHNWFYYEIRHEGESVVVTRGLHCGFEVLKKTALGADVDSSGAWAAFLQHDSSTGRKGRYVKEGTSCHLSLDKEYVVRGATIAYYTNPAVALPTKTQQASASAPGWEDWDNDGNPGISLKVTSAVASGTLYTAQRDWTQYDGTTPLSVAKLKVSITYDGEQVPLGRSSGSSSAIESSSAPSSDATQHYAWMAKLADGQATGTDTAICAAVRSLKDTLVPEANQ